MVENVPLIENRTTPKLLSIGDSTTIDGITYTVFKEPKIHRGDAFERPDGTFFKTYVKVLNQGKDFFLKYTYLKKFQQLVLVLLH